MSALELGGRRAPLEPDGRAFLYRSFSSLPDAHSIQPKPLATASAPELSLRALNRATLARQMLLERAAVPVEEAVARLAGMQAQIPRPPYLGLWTRLAGFEREALSAALRARRVVRATAWRGTLHLLTADDLLAFRGALQPMLSRGMQSILRNRTESFDMESLLAEARAFFARQPATFDAARAHLAARFPVADERAMGYAVRTHLPLVQVPDGSAWGFPAAADFALAEDWLGGDPDRQQRTAGARAALPRGVRAGERHRRPELVRHRRPARDLRGAARRARDLPRRARPRALRSP